MLTIRGILTSRLYIGETAVSSIPPGSIASRLWSLSVKMRCPLHQAKGGFTMRPLLVVWVWKY